MAASPITVSLSSSQSSPSLSLGVVEPLTEPMQMTVTSAAELWRAMQPLLIERLSPASYQTWLAPLTPHQWDEATTTLSLTSDSHFKKDWVAKHYQTALEATLRQVSNASGATVSLLLGKTSVAQPSLLNSIDDDQPKASTPPNVEFGAQPSHQTVHPQLRALAYNGQKLNANYQWGGLITGPHNQFAVSAGQAVASQPGQQFNPLCLHGGTGLGKTHLMQAIAHQCQAAGQEVCYVTAEQFTNELITAVSKKQWQPFRNRYRQVDVLLIDDVQFLGGKERTQQEFFHTLNTLVENGKQVILSSDRPPATLDMLDERLRSRFEMGLLVEITPPDEATRMAIIQAKAKQANLLLDNDVLEFLAQRFTQHVRQLEGAINTLQAMVTLAGKAPTLQAVQKQFGGAPQAVVPTARPAVNSLTMVVDATAAHFGVSVEQLCGQQRGKQVAAARQVACYLMRELTSASHADIGRAIGGRQHSTVVHAVKKVNTLIGDADGSHQTAQHVHQITQQLQHESLL